MGWKCQYTDIPENPFRYPKAHISQLAQLPSFLSPSPSTSSLLQGSWWWLVVCASWWGRFQSFGFAVHVCVSAVCYLSVSLLPVLCRSPGVPGSGCESVRCGGGRDALQRSVRGSTDPACPAALLTHLAFPAAFPWLPGTPAFFQQVTVNAKLWNSSTGMFHCQTLVPHTTSK